MNELLEKYNCKIVRYILYMNNSIYIIPKAKLTKLGVRYFLFQDVMGLRFPVSPHNISEYIYYLPISINHDLITNIEEII